MPNDITADEQASTRSADWPYFWGPFAIVLALVFWVQRANFSGQFNAWGDAAINGLSVLRAEHLDQLVGNYSRVGFHHPGPVYFYVEAFGEKVFHDLLGLVPGPYNGSIMAVQMICVAAVAAVAVLVRLATSSGAAALVAGAMAFAFTAKVGAVGNDWFPNLYVTAFLVFVVAAATVAAGYTGTIPFYVAASATLVHGHASFLLFVGATTLVAAAAWWVGHRNGIRAEAAQHRRALWAGAGIAGIFGLPMLLDLILHFPGEWPLYFHYGLHAERAPRDFADLFAFWIKTINGTDLRLRHLAIAGVIGLILLVTERARDRRRLFLSLHVAVALETALFFYYLARGVDALDPWTTFSYVGRFYQVVPLIFVVAVVVHLILRIRSMLGTWAGTRIAMGALALVVASFFLVLGAREPLLRTISPPSTYPAAASTIQRLADARLIDLKADSPGAWPTAAAIALELERRHQRWCVSGLNASELMYGRDHVCTARQTSRALVVVLDDEPGGKAGRELWRSGPNDPVVGPGPVRVTLPR
ncbi:MAG: hypothetical protein ACJ71Z_02820 [Aeromicrobium sp.]